MTAPLPHRADLGESPDLVVDRDGFELWPDGSEMTAAEKAADRLALAREYDEQAAEATDPRERTFYRELAAAERAQAHRPADRPCAARMRPRARQSRGRAVRTRGSRRVTSRSAGGGSSGDPDSDEPPGGRHDAFTLIGAAA